MRTKSRAQQVVQRTRKRPSGQRFTPRTRPVPVTVGMLNLIAARYVSPQLADDLNRTNVLMKRAGGASPVSRGETFIPVSKQLLEDAWQ